MRNRSKVQDFPSDAIDPLSDNHRLDPEVGMLFSIHEKDWSLRKTHILFGAKPIRSVVFRIQLSKGSGAFVHQARKRAHPSIFSHLHPSLGHFCLIQKSISESACDPIAGRTCRSPFASIAKKFWESHPKRLPCLLRKFQNPRTIAL